MIISTLHMRKNETVWLGTGVWGRAQRSVGKKDCARSLHRNLGLKEVQRFIHLLDPIEWWCLLGGVSNVSFQPCLWIPDQSHSTPPPASHPTTFPLPLLPLFFSPLWPRKPSGLPGIRKDQKTPDCPWNAERQQKMLPFKKPRWVKLQIFI